MITSLQNERVKAAYKLKKNHHEYFLIEDVDLLNEALKLGLVKEMFVCDPKYLLKEVPCLEVSPSIIKKLSFLSTPSGFVAICRHPSYKEAGNLVIALDGIQDPGNAGTILRSALAFGFEEMLLSTDSIATYNDKFIRSTKGAFFHLPLKRVDLKEELLKRKKDGYQIVNLDLTKNTIPLNALERKAKMVLVVGSEGQGISKEIKALADITVKIPMEETMESLNAAIAASIAMAHIYSKK